jgi:hypothetical protein
MRFLERLADLPQHVNDARGRLRSEFLHQYLQANAVQQLHDVVEGVFLRNPEIEQVDGMRGL